MLHTLMPLSLSPTFAHWSTWDLLTNVWILGACGLLLSCWLLIFRKRSSLARRLTAIEVALQSPNLNPEVQRELVHLLRPRRRVGLFKLAWIGVSIGIGWLLTKPDGHVFTVAVMVTAASFALLTLPLALREMDQRRG